MNKKSFEVFVEEGGDRSVGIYPVMTMKAELDKYFVEYLKEENLLKKFEERLQALVEEFYEAETGYETYDTDLLEAERAWEEEHEKEMQELGL